MLWKGLYYCLTSNITAQMHFVHKFLPNALVPTELKSKLSQDKKIPSKKVIKFHHEKK